MARKTKKVSKPDHEFKKGDLVAAKVKGYNFWPGIIEDVGYQSEKNKRPKYVVKFFATNERGTSFVALKPLDKMTQSEKSHKTKKFVEAMQLCMEYLESSKKTTRTRSARILGRKEEQESGKSVAHAQERKEEPIEDHAEQLSPSTAVQDEEIDSSPLPPTPTATSSSGNEDDEQNEVSPDSEDENKSDVCTESNQDRVGKIAEKAEANNNTENAHDDRPDAKLDCLPDLSSPDDEIQESRVADPKMEESSKHCSLNDLTSEQANADRGNEPPNNKPITTRVTKRALTLAKLKKKIDIKMREKEEKKAAFKDQKSFEKASKGLPTLVKKFQPLFKSGARLKSSLRDEKAAEQFTSSLKQCERYIESLAKCLKLMTTAYGRQQRDCYDFHCQLKQIVETLKFVRKESLPISSDCKVFIQKLRKADGIKKFINEMIFPDYNDSLAERKENSKMESKRAIR